MNLDLMIKQREEPNMELDLRQNVRNIGKEVIALHIQEYRYITLVSHYFIHFLHLQVHIYLLILFVYIFREIILFGFLGDHVLGSL